jgi:1L-myo-inositol 1-phosphate cytidylyltransferase / CDP-L-myo-inositol myo-inositolphosphotransferase
MPRPERAVLFAPPGAGLGATTLFGLHPAERTALGLLRSGVRELAVTGDAEAAERVLRLLAAGPCRSARLSLVPVEKLTAWLDGDEAQLLARADYWFDRRLLARFAEETEGALATVVAVDFRRDALAAQTGAPRVMGWHASSGVGPGEGVSRAGQGLRAPDGVLVGLARVTAAFARALEDAPPEARSLENALSLVARREPVATFSVAELWQAVRAKPALQAEDVIRARRKVLAAAVGVSDGLIARHLNRPLSQRITERLLSRNVSPWQISLASFAATLAAGLSFAMGHATTGGLVAQFASVLDGVDGEVARIRYQDSPFGGVYDALLDRIGDAALIGGMTLYGWLMGAGHSVVALGFAAVAGSSLSMLVKEKYGTQFARRWGEERDGRWRWLLLGRDGRLFLSLVAGLTGHVEAVLAYLALGTHVHAGVRIFRIRSEAQAAAG